MKVHFVKNIHNLPKKNILKTIKTLKPKNSIIKIILKQ